VVGSYVRLAVNKPEGVFISTSRVGGFLSANIPAEVDETIASVARTMKLTHSMVKAKMSVGRRLKINPDDEEPSFVGSEILHEFHLGGQIGGSRVDAVNAVRTFQWVNNYRDFEPENPSMEAFMSPLVNGSFVPAACVNNDNAWLRNALSS
jgi:hypothetical protein